VIRCVLALVLLTSLPAYAEDIVAYQAEGDAPTTSTDPRVMALDEAFARAVTTALGELVDGALRTQRKGELDKEIIGHARLWVAKYSVTKDETIDGRRELTVMVRIDRDKVRAKLGELGIATQSTTPVLPPETGMKTITVLMRKDPPSALTTVLRGAGFAVRRAPALPDGELSDDAADALAAEAKADTYVVANVAIAPPVAVRGQPMSSSLVTAELRMFDRPKKLIAQATGLAATRGEDSNYAIDRALLAAAADVLPPPPMKLQAGAFQGDDRPIGEPGVVLVRLPAKTPYSQVLAEQKYLAGAKGVRAATLRRLSPNGWVIGVSTGEAIEQVARIAKKAPTSDTSSTVKIVGDIVEVTLTGAL
jgi:hypothetical protein